MPNSAKYFLFMFTALLRVEKTQLTRYRSSAMNPAIDWRFAIKANDNPIMVNLYRGRDVSSRPMTNRDKVINDA